MWEDVCRRYDEHQIGQYQFEEMKETIWPNLHALALLRQSINDTGDDTAHKAAPSEAPERKSA